MKRAAGLIACAVLLVASLVLGSPSAAALISAGARSASTAVSSAAWGVAPAATDAAPTNKAHQIQWTNMWLATEYEKTFDLVGVGTLETTGQTIDVTTTRTGGIWYQLNLSLTACVGGGWTNRTCSGKSVPLGSDTDGSLISPTTFRIAPGQRVSVLAVGSSRLGTDYTTTVNVSVNRSQVRPSLKTNR